MNRKDLLIMQLKSVFFTFVFLLVSGVLSAQEKTLTLADINIRDPFILPVEKEGIYYMYASSSVKENGLHYGGMVAYKSRFVKTYRI